MAKYIIRRVPVDGPIKDAAYTGTKHEAMQLARRIAETQFAGATVKHGGGDAYVAYRDNVFVGSVGVEPWAAWRDADPDE